MPDAAGRPVLLFLLNDAPFYVSHRLSVGIAAKAAGFDVHVAAPHHDAAVARIRAAGLAFHDIPLRRGATAILGELRLIGAMAALLMRLRPDVLHAVAMKPVCYGGSLARLLGIRASVLAITGLGYLFVTETTAARTMRRIALALYRFALGQRPLRAIFQNPDDLALFRTNDLVDPATVAMIRGCGVDMTRFASTPEPEGEPIVMFPARILGDKGVHEFVAAARMLKEAGIKARFVMVGRTDPDNPTDVGEAEIRRWIEAGWVEWWGFSEDMPKTLAQSTIICMPSYREGLPRGLIEAAACERAIVATDVPGCREVVRHEENGLLVPVRDGAATAAALRRLIEDVGLRRRLAARGRAIAVAEFSVEDFVTKSLGVYRDVMTESGSKWP
ncbi:MAG: glycosyltransferase family 4 protein [Alphaproteobacteria bacterium]|nr:glycosyltransferase family 4 protein [Alphaproteobacteria bacterium]